MPLSDLPFEHCAEKTRDVESEKDLGQLRPANSTLNESATPPLFATIRNEMISANRFWKSLHEPVIAQHVRSVVYSENIETETRYDSQCRQSIRLVLVNSFSNLHQLPHLKELALRFDGEYHPVTYDKDSHSLAKIVSEIGNSHQWNVLNAIGNNTNPLPELESFSIHGWHFSRELSSLFDKDTIEQLITPLRYFQFSLPLVRRPGHSVSPDSEQPWKQVVVRRFLKPAVNLESLDINQMSTRQPPEFSQVQFELPTYSRLTVLSLRGVAWEYDKIGQELPPLADFIVRHGTTLKELNLSICYINVWEGSEPPPSCCWAAIYNRLTEALTELIEVNVESSGYLFPSQARHDSNLAENNFPYLQSLTVAVGAEQDRRDQEALKEFKGVVKSRAAATVVGVFRS